MLMAAADLIYAVHIGIREAVMGWQWLVLLIFTGLSTYRLTRLVVEDDFPPIAVPRRWITGEAYWVEDEQKWHYPHEQASWPRHWLGDLITCPWCAGGWISLGLVVAVATSNQTGTWVEWFLLWTAAWALGSTAAAKV